LAFQKEFTVKSPKLVLKRALFFINNFQKSPFE